ncbi:hypothetical protein NEAUS03_0039 [Nematocida ausubeli]|nr:hypothetical protein NEAUS03_0039 [Nematocida ausubeli]
MISKPYLFVKKFNFINNYHMDKKLALAVEQLETSSIVVSGPAGCGKTELIRKVLQDTEYKLAEIDSIEEYKTYRISKTIIYLLRVGDGMRIKQRDYRGIIFETENPYFYRKIKTCEHIKMASPTLRTVRKYCPSAMHKTSMHRILQAQRAPAKIQSTLLETECGSISFFHMIGKILYHKTSEVPMEVITAIEDSPFKVLLYLHENIPAFTEDVGSLARVLDKISLALKDRNQMFALVSEIWKLPRRSANTFYNIRTSPYNME